MDRLFTLLNANTVAKPLSGIKDINTTNKLKCFMLHNILYLNSVSLRSLVLTGCRAIVVRPHPAHYLTSQLCCSRSYSDPSSATTTYRLLTWRFLELPD